MPGRREHLEAQIAHFEHVAIGHVNSDVRRGRVTLHHDFGIGQVGEIESAAAMVGVGMGVNEVVEAEAVIGGDCDIAAGIFLERIDQDRAPRALARRAGRFCIYPDSVPGKT